MRRNQGPAVRALACLFLISVWQIAPAERPDFMFERCSLEQGFVQDSIFSICQDRKGFMWFGSEEGLIRYDGYSSRTFVPSSDNPLLPFSNQVSAICCSASGDLWVGFGKRGLAKLEAR